ncbi:MAG TPA: membrane protein insertion efficiency factor YidD [Thermoanaerobaculia bacterium]|nr:membrane protein insertion efficiency factor YidD [Thermoanaerobaculia bacterium]
MRVRLRIVIILAFFAVFIIVAHDGVVAPSEQFLTRPALSVIQGYRAHVSPHLRGVIRCRFKPSCSQYGLESVQKYGALRGGARALWRVVRCNPLTPQGTVDLP